MVNIIINKHRYFRCTLQRLSEMSGMSSNVGVGDCSDVYNARTNIDGNCLQSVSSMCRVSSVPL